MLILRRFFIQQVHFINFFRIRPPVNHLRSHLDILTLLERLLPREVHVLIQHIAKWPELRFLIRLSDIVVVPHLGLFLLWLLVEDHLFLGLFGWLRLLGLWFFGLFL